MKGVGAFRCMYGASRLGGCEMTSWTWWCVAHVPRCGEHEHEVWLRGHGRFFHRCNRYFSPLQRRLEAPCKLTSSVQRHIDERAAAMLAFSDTPAGAPCIMGRLFRSDASPIGQGTGTTVCSYTRHITAVQFSSEYLLFLWAKIRRRW